MLSITPRAKYRKVLTRLAHHPSSHGLPETPYLVAGVTFADVAEAMGVPRPALYRLWETQYDFWIDLSRYIAYEIDYSQPEQELPWHKRRVTGASRPRLAAAHGDMQISANTNAVQSIVMDDFRILIRAASIGYPDIANLGQVRRQVETERLESLGEEIASSWASIDGPTLPPEAELEIAATMWCIADEISVLNRFVPEVCAEHVRADFGQGEHSWSMLGLVMRSLCHGLSTAGSQNGPRSTPSEWYEIPPPDEPWSEAQLAALDAARRLFVDSFTVDDMAAERPVVLGYVTIGRVASAAGVSRRTIYNVWPTRDHMMTDLLDDLLTQHVSDVVAPFEGAGGEVDLGAITAALLGPAGMSAPADPLLTYMIDIGNEQHHAAIRSANLSLITRIAAHLDAWFDSADRRPRDGITFEQLAVIWLCLVRGGRRLRRTCPHITITFDAAIEVIMRELSIPR